MKLTPFRRLIPPEVAVARLLSSVRPVRRTELCAVTEAAGRVAARAYLAPMDVPPFARASWDGYAVRASDCRRARPGAPRWLRVAAEAFAEQASVRPVRPGECVAIATGAPLPPGADAVVIFEVVTRRPGRIGVCAPVPRGDRIAEAGEDFRRGTVLVRRGELIGPAAAGTLAASGLARVRVYSRPIVAVVPNGNELVSPGARRRPGTIYESNNATLSGVLRALGADAVVHPPVRDDPARIEAAIRRAQGSSDLVLVTGGSSVGERDFLATVFPRLGRLLFHGIAIRPGKPTLACATPRGLVVGLPGHPTSCLVDAYWMLMPVLRRLSRRPGPGWTDRPVRLGADYELPTAGLSTVIPLRLRGRTGVPTFRSSASLTSLTEADAFALVGPRRIHLRRGDRVIAHRLPEALTGSAGGSPG